MPGRYDAHDMFMLQQYLEKHLESSSNNYSSKTFPFAVDQMPYEDKIINHDVAENLEMLQQTLDNIVVDSLQRVAAITIQRAWKFSKKRGDERHKFANIVNAAIKIARAFRYYKMRKNRKVLLYKSGQPQPRQAKISYYIDSDSSTSQDESEDEEDYLHDYDTGCFIRLPRKAYAAQKIQSCVRGYMVRKKCVELYTLVKSAQICIARYWRGYLAKLRVKRLRRMPFPKLVVDISDNDSWENQLIRIRSEANRRQMSIIPYKYTSPEKHSETTIAGGERKNVAVGMGRNGNMGVVATNERLVNSATVMYSSTAGWKRS
eukprot:g10549.t1